MKLFEVRAEYTYLVYAFSEVDAKMVISKEERCPLSSIQEVNEVPLAPGIISRFGKS